MLPNRSTLLACTTLPCASLFVVAHLLTSTTGHWGLVGNANFLRQDHSTVVLPSGKALAMGGWDGKTPTATAELFDPATSARAAWSQTGSMNSARCGAGCQYHLKLNSETWPSLRGLP